MLSFCRTLNVKERMIYAPMSGVGGIIYDQDAVYIDVQDNRQSKTAGGDENQVRIFGRDIELAFR